LIFLTASLVAAEQYDLVITGGRVMDPETQYDAVANVGIRNGRIIAITQETIHGSAAIDARGLVVAPGFIDTHFHALDGLSVRLAARDGVTTGMDLELGAYNVAQWYAEKENRWPLNYGTTASQEVTRMLVHDPEIKIEGPVDATRVFELRAESEKDGVIGWSETRSSLEQMNQVTAMLDEQLRLGALGVGSTVGYARRGISSYEMFEAQRAAARYGRLTSVHTRFHSMNKTPTEATLAFAEIYTNASLLNAPLLMAHNNDYGWREIEEKLQLAREQGHNMWSEYYPYDSASTSIGSEFLRPAMIEDAMGLNYEDILFDPIQDKFLSTADYKKVVAEDPGRTVIIFNPARKQWLPNWLEAPHMTVAADSMWCNLSWDASYDEYQGHPRTAGSHGKVLAMAREQGVPLMTTLAQMSYLPAKHLGDTGIEAMKIRGRLQLGMVADITIFHPGKVKDNATYQRGEQGRPTTDIPYVIVNGKTVIKESRFQHGVWAGKPIRFAVEAAGRFVPATFDN